MGRDHAAGSRQSLEPALLISGLTAARYRGFALVVTGNPIAAMSWRKHMPTFVLSLNWTDQGIRSVKDAPKRSQATRQLAKNMGIEIKQVYLTSGESDLLVIVESLNGDNVAKFALAVSAQGNVRTRTARAWSETEFQKLVAELP
jgi:uncharacterized protein with GYD domain